MTRTKTAGGEDRVSLSTQNWIALVALLVAIVAPGAAWMYQLDRRVAVIEASAMTPDDAQHLNRTLTRFSTQVEELSKRVAEDRERSQELSGEIARLREAMIRLEGRLP